MQTVLNLLEVEPIRLLVSFGAVLFLVLNLAAVLTMAERKVSGYIHLRFGPNRVGPRGLLQPAADVFKLFTKEELEAIQWDSLEEEMAGSVEYDIVPGYDKLLDIWNAAKKG